MTPSWDLRTLCVDNDHGNSLTPIDPRTGSRTGGRSRSPTRTTSTSRPTAATRSWSPRPAAASTSATRTRWRSQTRCRAVPRRRPHGLHGRRRATCSPAASSPATLVEVDLATQRVVGTLPLPRPAPMPQDVKLSPDGRVFYVADMMRGGVWVIDARRLRVLRLHPTGAGAHGLYPSRDARDLYVTNRATGTISRRSTSRPRGSSPRGGSPAAAAPTWAACPPTAGAVAVGPLRRRGLRDRHRDRPLLARIPVGARPARPVRVAAAGPLLARPHRHPPVAAPRGADTTAAWHRP